MLASSSPARHAGMLAQRPRPRLPHQVVHILVPPTSKHKSEIFAVGVCECPYHGLLASRRRLRLKRAATHPHQLFLCAQCSGPTPAKPFTPLARQAIKIRLGSHGVHEAYTLGFFRTDEVTKVEQFAGAAPTNEAWKKACLDDRWNALAEKKIGHHVRSTVTINAPLWSRACRTRCHGSISACLLLPRPPCRHRDSVH